MFVLIKNVRLVGIINGVCSLGNIYVFLRCGKCLPVPVAARCRRRSGIARLQRGWVRIPLRHGYLSVVNVVYCLCDEFITRPDESFRLWCVVVFRGVWSRNHMIEEDIARVGGQRQKKYLFRLYARLSKSNTFFGDVLAMCLKQKN
jgi:hypothetical protein